MEIEGGENGIVNNRISRLEINSKARKKMKKSLLSISLAICMIIVLAFSGCSSKSSTTSAPANTTAPTSSSAAAQTLNIGAIWNLTGTGSDSEAVMVKGMNLCIDYVNNNGGITVNGVKYKLKVTTLDAQSTTAGSVTAAQQLVSQNKVSFVIGETTPWEVEAIRGVTDPNKVLYVSGTNDTPSDKFPYTITALYPYKWPKTPLYDYLVKTYPNVKTVAVLNQDEAGNMASGAEGIAQIQKHGLTLGDHLIYPFATTDYLPVVTKLVATNPDAIDMCLNMPSNAALIVKYARQAGFTGPIMGASPWDPTTELNMIGANYATDFIWNTIDTTAADAQSQLPVEMTQVMKLWNDTYHVPFVLDSLQGWDSLIVLTQAIEAAQSLDPTAVMQAFGKMGTINTAWGKANIGGLQTYGINAVVCENIPLTRLQKG